MNADLRVIQLIRKHRCTFVPEAITDYLITSRHNKDYPEEPWVAQMIISETITLGQEKGVIDLTLMKLDRRRSKKTLLQYFEWMRDCGVITLDKLEMNKVVVGFNPEKFGSLFPTYEQALKITGP